MKPLISYILGLFLGAALATGQSAPRNPALDMWDDPNFVKSFTASFGVLSGFEPEISDPEKVILRDLMPAIRNNPREAINTLRRAINRDSTAAFDFILANLHFQEGNLEEAARYYRNAIQKYPNFRRAHKNLGLVLVQKENFKEAITAISKGLALGDVDARSYGLLGFSYLTEGLYYPAEAAYRQAILMQPEVRDWRLGLARCLIETGDYRASIALFDTLLKQEPDNADFWLLQANAFIGKDEALSAAQNIEIVRRMGSAELASLTMLGDIYMNNDSPRLALSAYLEAIERPGSENSQALIRAAELFTSRGDFNQAQTLISRLRSHFADNLAEDTDLKLLTLEAKIARARGDEEEAFDILVRIVERDALNGEALIELGNYYAAKGDQERAINRFQQAQQIPRFERQALIAHAQVLVRKPDYRKALELLRRAHQLQADRYLADYIERIERAVR